MISFQGRQTLLGVLVLLAGTHGDQDAPSVGNQSKCESRLLLPQPDRLVAIGDIHGDLSKLKEALTIARVWDDTHGWIGGSTVVVQLGDQVDRGDDELEVTALLRQVALQAKEAGGALHILLGNHEIMSAQGDIRYATPGAAARFHDWNRTCSLPDRASSAAEEHHCDLWEPLRCPDKDVHCQRQLMQMPAIHRSRFLALRAGGPIARNVWGKERRTMLVIGDTLFVHGGIDQAQIAGGCSVLDDMDRTVAAWMEGQHDAAKASEFWTRVTGRPVGPEAPAIPAEYSMPPIAGDQRGPFWNRVFALPQDSQYGGSVGPDTCRLLDETLGALPVEGVRRMVVGHTVQQGGIVEDCRGAGWGGSSVVKVDVGMSAGMLGAEAEVLEILSSGKVTTLRASGPGQPQPPAGVAL